MNDHDYFIEISTIYNNNNRFWPDAPDASQSRYSDKENYLNDQ